MQFVQNAAMTAAQHLREDQCQGADQEPTDCRARPAWHSLPAKQRLGRGHSLHDRDAEPGRGKAEAEKGEIVEPPDRDFMAHDKNRVRPDEPSDNERSRQGADADRGQRLQGIDADDQLEGVEGTSEGSIERRRNCAGGATADKSTDIVPAQARRSAEPGRERGPNLRIGRFEPHRGAKSAGKQRQKDEPQAVTDRHPSAEQRVRLDRVDNLALTPASQ